jgi:hypothetical protein
MGRERGEGCIRFFISSRAFAAAAFFAAFFFAAFFAAPVRPASS